MPRDKTATHERLIPIVREEFLTYGYEKASVNRIAETAGMSAAGLYRHYRDKEDMFSTLVADTLTELEKLTETWRSGTVQHRDAYDPFGDAWVRQMLDFIYGHFDGLRLLVCCAAGSKYEDFEEQLIAWEEDSSKAFAESLAERGGRPMVLTDAQWHLTATLYIRALTEIIRHDMAREEAERHIAFLREFLYPGMRKLFGL